MSRAGKWENLGSFSDRNGKRLGVYGIRADSDNNLYLLDFQSSTIGIIDAKTGKFTAYAARSPTRARAAARSMGRTGCGTPNTPATRSACSIPRPRRSRNGCVPTPWAQPYDVVVDKNGEAWTGSMMSDRVSRLDPKTGEYVEYQLPKTTNIRRVFVDNSTTPVTFWIGSNHGASIIKLEPLD